MNVAVDISDTYKAPPFFLCHEYDQGVGIIFTGTETEHDITPRALNPWLFSEAMQAFRVWKTFNPERMVMSTTIRFRSLS